MLIPLLTGLLLVSFLLPRLSHLKLVGLEADVTESAAPVATGPRGEISFSTSSPSAADTR